MGQFGGTFPFTSWGQTSWGAQVWALDQLCCRVHQSCGRCTGRQEEATLMASNPSSKFFTCICATLMVLLLLHKPAMGKLTFYVCSIYYHTFIQCTILTLPMALLQTLCALPLCSHHHFFILLRYLGETLFLWNHSGRDPKERCRKKIQIHVGTLWNPSIPIYLSGKGQCRPLAWFSVPLSPCVKEE